MQNEEEEFEIFEEEYPYRSKNILVKRSIVHKTGLIHKSVNLFIVSKDKTKILVQKRSPHKDICPNCWDLSCAEHLKPKETFEQGIIRGCMEELNLSSITSSDLQLIRDATLHKAEYKNGTIKDYEISCLYMLVIQNDELELKMKQLEQFTPNEEVAQIEWKSIDQIANELHTLQRQQYTEWFIDGFEHFYKQVYLSWTRQ